ncbi:hypothetical protein NF27_DP00170 [Candidatus Jidaibacter acanthamoeba]|uniref:Uncharacterized protein n=1 Tax=Candidatus Jidaibacter acanthamoebae TaxID=86105 RepID=A0A0C1QN83_9RICK|nr:ankyrin repeat domain-containing protein [Candidatus Jidaibacter acanthamoeba]KIE05473.1 hypothetical protein NF27_DP00170 [Candidatus Jidaibacter acanthamoeba]
MSLNIANSITSFYYNHGSFENEQQKLAYSLAKTIIMNDKENIAKVLEKSANINGLIFEDENNNYYTPLQYAVELQNKELVEMLINKGADVNIKFYDNSTLLHKLVTSPHEIDIEIAKVLINHGFNVNALDNQGASPFYKMLASSTLLEGWDKNKIGLLNQILDQEISNFNVPDDYIGSIVHSAITSSLYQPSDKEKDIYIAEAVKKMLDKGVHIDEKYETGSELEYALRLEQFSVAKLLICNGASKDLVSEDYQHQIARLGEFNCDEQFTIQQPIQHEEL